jgi:hypothetical protein
MRCPTEPREVGMSTEALEKRLQRVVDHATLQCPLLRARLGSYLISGLRPSGAQ